MGDLENKLSDLDIKRLLGTTPAHFCKTTSDGRFVWMSPGWEEVLGMPIDVIAERPFLEYIHPDDIEVTRKAMQRLNEGEAVVDFVNRYQRTDGSYVWLRWYSKAHDGHYYAVAAEQSSSRDQQTELDEYIHLLELTEELGEIGQWRVDLVTNTLHWSSQVFKIHGLDPETYTPELESAINAYHPDDRETVSELVQRAIEEKQDYSFQLRLIRTDGEVRDVASRCRVECNSQGEVVSLIGIFQDVTDWQRLQRRLQEIERFHSVSTLAAGVAHEINNPLQYVMTSLSLALSQLDRPALAESRLRGLLEDAEHGVKQVAHIVRHLSAFVKRDADHPRDAVSLKAVLDATVNMTRNELRHKIELTASLGETPKVTGQHTELVQVFVNLVTNAYQALKDSQEPNGRIRVTSLTRSDGWAVVEVEDNGPGIGPENLQRVFEPFFSTKAVGEGTGLGLYVSQSIVRRLGGEVTVESQPGKTCFRVVLPPAGREQGLKPVPSGLAQLLIVDDEPRVAQTLSQLLRNEYFVVPETDPEAALSRVRAGQHFDLILVDAVMPGMTGWQLLERIADYAPTLFERSVVMTGALDPLAPSPQLADIPVLSKPFRKEDLLNILAERFLRSAKAS